MDWQLILTLALPAGVTLIVAGYLRYSLNHKTQLEQLNLQRDELYRLLKEQQNELHEARARFDQHQLISLATLQESLQKSMQEIRNQLELTLNQQSQSINLSLDKLTQATQERLREISGQVDKRLTEGFEKTTATFTDVMKRLTIIDEAQKKITELSTNVVSLQEVLSDKKTRGAFGEVQLNAIIRNVIPEAHFKLQHEFSNGKRVDCLLLLPEPTGNIAIDSKFPLETYKQLMNTAVTDPARSQLEKQFKVDIRHHIQEIAKKYIIPGETSDGAVMFIPAEAIFAEIHAYHPDVIEAAHQARVWLVSPTTMMAILTTARAVLKDAATRKQVHIIQEHLVMLGKDFERFQDRMDNLAKHIDQAQADVEQVHQSSKKITGRFNKIEKVDLSLDDAEALLIE
ncbi:MAG TPA: DNA recombination protein RmuC [Coxiellaceae bacterium]|nr:DNA recombination protein RmuC [Coxiellaceae bacterium]